MKQVFPGIRPRRLGTRGHSRYCYAAMRKTRSLEAPHLPQLGIRDAPPSTDTLEDNKKTLHISEDTHMQNIKSEWHAIRSWAENILKIKLENVEDLVEHINGQNTQKKSGNILQRELKEKRLLTDMGPLKKRRKKKRKGSSSSESSASQQTATTDPCPESKQLNVQIKGDEQQQSSSSTIFNQTIKQEILDSPTFKQNTAAVTTNTQTMPINLATEQRAINHPLAVKNLTSKIMEMSADVTQNIKQEVVDDYTTPTIYCKKVLKAHQTKGFWVNSPSAQQQPQPPHIVTTAASNIVVPIITKTLASPPPSSLRTTSADSNTHFMMGPPAHQANNISTSPLAVLNDNYNNNAKSNSHHMLTLRGKRQQALQTPTITTLAHTTTTTTTTMTTSTSSGASATVVDDDLGDDKDAELPENLGLPRERVISICNMDKHELDDYFLPVQEEEEEEEENSQDQDSELLQYFQTGDAEEKSNSLDAIKHRNPTATTNTNTTTTTTPSTNDNNRINNAIINVTGTSIATTPKLKTPPPPPTTTTTNIDTKLINNNNKNIAIPITTTTKTIKTTTTTTTATTRIANLQSIFLNNAEYALNNEIGTTTAVGSASASLVLLSKKHQQQPQQQQQQLEHTKNKNTNNNYHDKDILTTVRKNRIFVPISPNINATTTNSTTKNALFASPILATRSYGKPTLFFKQQSLDSDCDPMIGANQQQRNFNNSLPFSNSASAPPSPSIFQQQQQQQQQLQITITRDSQAIWLSPHINNTVDQNSLDLDLFTTAANALNDMPITSVKSTNDTGLNDMLLNNEIQRSQSVPLSQLQRMQSPLTFKNTQDFELVKCTSSTDKAIMSASDNNTMKLEEPCVLATDSTTLLDDVDYSVMLSSPDFLTKFTTYPQTETAPGSSSAGSSSGYSSGTCSAISRSVPSTPLPHHQHNMFSQKRHNRAIDDTLLQNSPTCGNMKDENVFKYSFNGMGFASNAFVGCARVGGYDMSKSMPTTPITTPCFRYSPNELTGDFLINGHTMDNMQSFGNGLARDCDIRAASNGLVSLGMNGNALLDCDVDVVTNTTANIVDNEDYVSNSAAETEAIMIGAALLDDL